jgi:hypothetical protein
MKTKQIGIIVFASILLIAIFTNPSQDEHKEKVKETFTAYYQKSLKESQLDTENSFAALGSLLGESFINKIIENAVTRENYMFFSLTKVTFKGEEKSIGYGIFGNVFLSEKVEEAFNKNVN